MLKDIHIKGTFGHQDSYFEFKNGLTAITGLNGKGKSMIMEMVQFAYWGLAALRGVADDYKSLSVVHRFWVKDHPYTINRTIKSATLFSGHGDDKKPEATGTKIVNKAVADLFGYSMPVFQVANAVNQKQVDAFCAMLPTARKRLVDETIGLSALDGLNKWIDENVTGLRASIKARGEMLVAPVEPVKPEGYRLSSDIVVDLGAFNAAKLERDRLRVIANQPLVEPTVVDLHPEDANLEKLQAETDTYKALLVEADHLGKEIVALGEVKPLVDVKLAEDDDKLEEYRISERNRFEFLTQKKVYDAELARFVEPAYTREQLTAMEVTHHIRDRWHLREELINKGLHYHCENCQHDGMMVDPRVKTEFDGIPEERPEAPALTMQQIAVQDRLIKEWSRKQDLDARVFEVDRSLYLMDDRSAAIKAIEAARVAVAANAANKVKHEREAELDARRADLSRRVGNLRHRGTEIAAIAAARTAVAVYQSKAESYKIAAAKVEEAKRGLEAFDPTLDDSIILLNKERDSAMYYETHKAAYDVSLETYNKELFKQGVLNAELEDWQKAKEAVVVLRTRIKGYLLPSLNKVASYLLSEFSGGALTWIVINDDFEVIVDGKRVETLSGGQKTIANLAIRIGLGQVLTNKVFSVMMLDEPDESCDDIVAGLIEKTLNVLKKQFKQVFLITHKSGGEADNRIHLE